MLPYVVFFLMLISLTLLISAYYNNHRSRVVFKCITSFFFLTIGLTAYMNSNINFFYFIFMFTGLCFSFIGDFALALYNRCGRSSSKPFIAGIASFSVTHILYLAAFSSLVPISIKDIILYAVAASLGLTFMLRCKDLDFKKYTKFVVTYILLVIAMLVKALSTNSLITEHPAAIILITCGAVLFFASDFILSFIYFKKDSAPYLTAVNLTSYYIGQGLLALSIMFI